MPADASAFAAPAVSKPRPDADDRPTRPLATAMAALATQLGTIRPLLGAAGEVAYLDIPFHPNVGDRLIQAGTEAFFRQQGIRVVYRCTAEGFDEARLRAALGPGTVIALHGGGNFGTLYSLHQHFRERVVQAFPDRAIVVLPQSVHFEAGAEAERSAAIFRTHKHLAICVRDRESAAVAGAFSPTVLLAPDMAHALWGELRATGAATRTDPLFLMRTDKESRVGSLSDLPAGARVTDWLTWLDRRERRLRTALKGLHGLLNRAHSVPLLPRADRVVDMDGAMLIRKAVRLFSEHPRIVTDRLHAVLLASLLQREAHYTDNSYGKLSRYMGCWLDGVETIRRIDAPAPAPAAEG